MSRAALLLAVLAFSACSAPARSIHDFKAHPDEIAGVLALCNTGAQRGVECDNAKAAEVQIDSDKRLRLYKQIIEAGHGQ